MKSASSGHASSGARRTLNPPRRPRPTAPSSHERGYATTRDHLKLNETAARTGFFSVEPLDEPPLAAALDYLRNHPTDGFMHAHLLRQIGGMGLPAVRALLTSDAGGDPVVRALLLEAATVHTHLNDIAGRFDRREAGRLADRTPLIYLRSAMRPDQRLHRQWARLFHANRMRHRPLAPPRQTGLRPLFDARDGRDAALPDEAHLKAVSARLRQAGEDGGATPRPPLEETIQRAPSGLTALQILDGPEMRHQASLSRFALLRKWRFTHAVKNGALTYSLRGTQASCGRGLALESAKASCLMEVAERRSSFAGVDASGVVGTQRPHPLIHDTRSRLMADGIDLLDPNRLGLEVPYRDEPLYWVDGHQRTADGFRSIWVRVRASSCSATWMNAHSFRGLAPPVWPRATPPRRPGSARCTS